MFSLSSQKAITPFPWGVLQSTDEGENTERQFAKKILVTDCSLSAHLPFKGWLSVFQQ